MYISLVDFLPAVVMTFVYGSFSDRIGRRLVLIAPIIGSLSTILVQMVIVYFNLPVWCFLFGVVENFFGGFYLMITGIFAYIADTIPKERRAVRMTILDAIILGTAAISNIIVGFLIHAMGFFIPYIFCLAGKTLTLVYAVCFIPETVRRTTDNRQRICNEMFTNLKNGIKLYLMDNGAGRRLQLNLLLLSFLVGEMISTSSILTLFEMNSPLCWNSVFIGYFGATSDLIKCIGMIVAAFILKKWLSEKWLAALGLFSNVSYYLYLAFVVSTIMMFFCKYD